MPGDDWRRGINLAGVFDRRDGRRGWEVHGAHLDEIVSAGFGAIRLPVRWSGHTEEAAPYTVDEAWLALVDEVVASAGVRGLAVVLTMHHADPVYEDPAGSAGWLTSVWRQLAARFAGPRDPLAFELLNEPRAPMTAVDWNALLPDVLRAVREVDAGREVIVGGAEASSVAGLRQLELPPDEHLRATVHYYEPFRFTHQGASWEPGSAAWLGTQWGTPADHAVVTSDLEEAAAWARRHGVPLLVGEFGAIAAADHASRIRWTSWVRRELERLGLPWAYWDFATDFGAYDLERRAWREDVLGALFDS